MANTENTLLNLLALIEQTPGAYLSSTTHKYSALVGFIVGFSNGTQYALNDVSKVVFPQEFGEFVRAELNRKHGFERFTTSEHFFEMIRNEKDNEDEAFRLFFELWSKFRNRPFDE